MNRLGQTVIYMTTKEDRAYMVKLREEGSAGCNVSEMLPAIVVCDWGGDSLNLSVMLDGDVQPLWKTSVQKGMKEGQWLELEALDYIS